MNEARVLTIAKKELRGYFNNPLGYILVAVFLLVWQFLFFQNAFLVGEASLRHLFDLLPWLFLILLPALTMGSISQEKSEGTLELLLTHSVRDSELLLGKFLGSLGFVAIVLLFVVPVAVSFNMFGQLDWGVVGGQYLGSVLLAAVFISLGIFVSSLFSSAIAALLVTAVSSLALLMIGLDYVTARVPLIFVPIFERLSALSHFTSLARGVIDLRDVWYVVSAVVVFLSLAYVQLLRRRFGNRYQLYRRYQLGVGLLIVIMVLTNIIGSRIPGRLDVTQDRLYTLTPATRTILRQLPDVVTVTVFSSSKLPAQLQPVLRDIKDMLRDYEIASQHKVAVAYKDPMSQPEAASEAESRGVQQIQFNVVGQDELQVQRGYLGLGISYADTHEAIPFVQDTADLEYQLTSLIRKVTVADKKKVVFVSGHGEKTLANDYQILNQELQKQFTTEELTFTETESSIPDDTDVVVVAGSTQSLADTHLEALRRFIDGGGSVLFLVDTVTVSPQLGQANLTESNLPDFLHEYGVLVNENLVYDLRSHENVRVGGGVVTYVLPYPLWARLVAKAPHSPLTARLESIVVPWASSLTIDEGKIKERGLTATTLFATTPYGGQQQGSFTVAPDQRLPEDNLGEQVVAVSLTSSSSDTAKQSAGRLVVVGDSDFLTDQFVEEQISNLAFGVNALSWLGQEELLATIQSKQKAVRKLTFTDPAQTAYVKYGNMGIALLLPTIYGGLRLARRRRLQQASTFSRVDEY